MVYGLSNPFELLAGLALRETLGALMVAEDPEDIEMNNLVNPPNADGVGQESRVPDKNQRRNEDDNAQALAVSKAHDTKLTDAEPMDATPTNSGPTDAKPTDSKPTDTKPTDTKPTDTKPTDAKLMEVEPTDAETANQAWGETIQAYMDPIDTKTGTISMATNINVNDIARKYGSPLQTLHGLGGDVMMSTGRSSNEPGHKPLKGQGAMYRSFAMMKQLVVAVPKRPDPPALTSDSAVPEVSAAAKQGRDGSTSSISPIPSNVTLVWRRGVDCLLHALFGNERNGFAWKREIIRSLIVPSRGPTGGPLSEQPCRRIEVLAAKLSEGPQQFLSVTA